jgi:hypothetical protein
MTLATQLLDQVLAMGPRLSREIADDAERSPYPVVTLPDGRIVGVRTDEVRSWIAQLAWEHLHVVPSASTIASVVTVLAGLALYGEQHDA